MLPNLRLSDELIDLMKDVSLSSAQAIDGAWGTRLRPSTPFDERYGRWGAQTRGSRPRADKVIEGRRRGIIVFRIQRRKHRVRFHPARRTDRVKRRELVTLLGDAACCMAARGARAAAPVPGIALRSSQILSSCRRAQPGQGAFSYWSAAFSCWSAATSQAVLKIGYWIRLTSDNNGAVNGYDPDQERRMGGHDGPGPAHLRRWRGCHRRRSDR